MDFIRGGTGTDVIKNIGKYNEKNRPVELEIHEKAPFGSMRDIPLS